MKQEFLNSLTNSNIDTKGAINRFAGNVDLFEKFIFKFPDDPTFVNIKPSFDSLNYQEALNAVHTLKGLSGNLGMTRLYNACSNTTLLLRAGKNKEAAASYSEIETSYNEIISIISKFKS